MSLVSDVITDIRYQIHDPDSTRFSDAYILNIVKLAIRRTNRILQRNGIQFAKKYTDLTTTDDVAYIAMPDDFDVDIGLYKTGSYDSLTKQTEDVWEQLVGTIVNAHYMLDYVNSRILLKATPTDSTTTLRLWYYPKVDPSAYTTASTMPWSGKLDDIIAQYVTSRLYNIDEMDVSHETQLLIDLEQNILQAYQPLAQQRVAQNGWME